MYNGFMLCSVVLVNTAKQVHKLYLFCKKCGIVALQVIF